MSGSGVRPAGQLVTVVSGKGGVGKTNLAANVAVAAAGEGARVLLVDGDLGLANVDVLLGLVPDTVLADALEGDGSLRSAVVEGPGGVHVLPAASGRGELAALSGDPLERLVAALRDFAGGYDLTLVDAGAGVGPAVVAWAAAADRRLLVTTAEPTSLVDAYAVLKVLCCDARVGAADLVVNDVRRERDAAETHARLLRLAERFLEVELRYLGCVLRDPRVAQAVQRQRSVVEAFPTSRAAGCFGQLARALLGAPGAAGT
ncbi:MAG: P-loop NTPase [Myxococcota bacterium]|nr:P-loop NTPase [Myxococcota bacterium]